MIPAPEQGARAVLGSALCVLATWAGLLTLAHLVGGTRWFVTSCVAVVVVAGATALTRAATRRWWVPTAVGTAVALVGVVLRYGAPPGRPQFLPDADAVGRAWATARQGVTVINDAFVPMPDVRPGEMLIVVGALAVFLLVDAAVLALRYPAVGGLPLLALCLPGVFLGFPAGGAALFWTAVAFLSLLAYGAAPSHAQAGRTRRAATAVVAAAAVAAGAVLAGPPLSNVPGWASVALPTFGDGPVGPLQLSDDLDLRESLGKRSSQVVLTYRVTDPTAPAQDGTATPTVEPTATSTPQPGATTSPAAPAVDARLVGPLRAFTMSRFDGRGWDRTDNDVLEPWDPAALLASDPQLRGSAPNGRLGTLATVDVQVGSLRERRLPISTFPRTVVLDGQWGYDPSRDEVVGRRATSSGLEYSMTVQVPRLTAADLRGAAAGTPTGPDAEDFTTVPGTAHRDDIAALAAEVTADAVSPYGRALDLQTWLRSTANFTYDTRVPPARTQDAVWDFLEDRRGYCVQFATAMAMMARTLDIPSRIGVGFLPGERQEDGSYVVTGRLAHAWPELYFEGMGWVRFEPTPASQSGAPPVWADPFTGISAPASIPDEILASRQAQSPGAVPTAPAGAPGAATGADERPWVVPVLAAGSALLLLAAGGVWLLLVRRRRARPTAPEDAWTLLRRELARADVRWSDATSPRGAVREIERIIAARSGRPLANAADDALRRLALAVEQTRYAPTPSAYPAEELQAWVHEARSGVLDALSAPQERKQVALA